jgi:4-diphosphocytidyl-2-C-methyl-D-erythritol kinase
MEKRIPLMSGLGGDSSDAAAVLRGLNEVWKLGLSPDKLLELALSLGSDVPFFLYGGTALLQGRGDIVTLLPPVSNKWVVLVMPDVPQEPGKTGQMYASLKTAHFTDGHITRRLVEVLGSHRELKTSMMFNTFENIAFNRFSVLSVYKDQIRKLGAFRVHLAGSGPALFAVFRDRRKADDLCTKCWNQGMESYLVETVM